MASRFVAFLPIFNPVLLSVLNTNMEVLVLPLDVSSSLCSSPITPSLPSVSSSSSLLSISTLEFFSIYLEESSMVGVGRFGRLAFMSCCQGFNHNLYKGSVWGVHRFVILLQPFFSTLDLDSLICASSNLYQADEFS